MGGKFKKTLAAQAIQKADQAERLFRYQTVSDRNADPSIDPERDPRHRVARRQQPSLCGVLRGDDQSLGRAGLDIPTLADGERRGFYDPPQ